MTDVEPVDGELLDGEADWEKPRRVNRLTWILLGVLVALLAFAGGVSVQKSVDSSLVNGRSRTFAGGGQGGGQGGAGETAGAQRTGRGSGNGQAGGTAGDTTGATPVVVGTVKAVSGQTLTVTDFGGATVTVHVAPGTPVTTPGLGGPAAGAPVSVAGTKAADGSVTATSVTVRAAGG